MQARAIEAEQEAENAFKQIEKLRKKPKIEASTPIYDTPIYDKEESNNTFDQQPEQLTSWFSGYDTCNI